MTKQPTIELQCYGLERVDDESFMVDAVRIDGVSHHSRVAFDALQHAKPHERVALRKDALIAAAPKEHQAAVTAFLDQVWPTGDDSSAAGASVDE